MNGVGENGRMTTTYAGITFAVPNDAVWAAWLDAIDLSWSYHPRAQEKHLSYFWVTTCHHKKSPDKCRRGMEGEHDRALVVLVPDAVYVEQLTPGTSAADAAQWDGRTIVVGFWPLPALNCIGPRSEPDRWVELDEADGGYHFFWNLPEAFNIRASWKKAEKVVAAPGPRPERDIVAISARLRFEVFKRDGFRCVYCGATPLQRPLHADHVVARANGGRTKADNLVTSCDACNLGKSAVPLDKLALESRMSAEQTKEHAKQIRSYLKAQKELIAARAEVVAELEAAWRATVVDSLPSNYHGRMAKLLEEFSLSELVEAQRIAGAAFAKKYRINPEEVLRYLYGIVRRWRSERGKG